MNIYLLFIFGLDKQLLLDCTIVLLKTLYSKVNVSNFRLNHINYSPAVSRLKIHIGNYWTLKQDCAVSEIYTRMQINVSL